MATEVEPANTADKFSANAEELESYYLMLEAGNIPELQWQFPGRREPSPELVGSGRNSKELEQTSDAIEQEPQKANDFDFSDDVAPTQMRVRSQTSTPKSAKKKTANFAGVMETLKKKNAESS
ncbi:PAXIP1-associated glutamate-rich protein 1 [Drosophila serrata]|uniref:PAXIP1-associated glutamate-rich protein 1 n=1 Tax=Drosophila serrata TaxID=7274 RepID=UPI000A1CF98B|nr:PAXIP1-associated glutamate-rich protein 1 [Drosophila serrata]KAH8265839.1 hypothetical protein KR038_004130 [Drosophila bunnanda]KAH8356906.1 hypothetical protein KR200_011359 [Drosophila serrata]